MLFHRSARMRHRGSRRKKRIFYIVLKLKIIGVGFFQNPTPIIHFTLHNSALSVYPPNNYLLMKIKPLQHKDQNLRLR